MKKMDCVFLFLVFFQGDLFAFNSHDLPKKMHLYQEWEWHENRFCIEANDTKMGCLHRNILSAPVSYHFYDESARLLTTIQSRFFSIGTTFDIYDDKENLLGSIEEKMFTVSPAFTMYSPDSVILATAGMNFWGTIFSIYGALGDEPMVVMSRPFFRVTDDWTIEIKNNEALKSMRIDSRLLLTVLAIQEAREYFSKQHHVAFQNDAYNEEIQKKITSLLNDLDGVPLLNQKSLEILAVALDDDYRRAQKVTRMGFYSEEKRRAFIFFCLDLIQSDQGNLSEKKGALYMLLRKIKAR